MPSAEPVLTWIAQARTSRHPTQFTPHALAAVTRTPLADTESAVREALERRWIVLQIHWICPVCSTTLAITEPDNPPTSEVPCDRCGHDLSRWSPYDIPQMGIYRTIEPSESTGTTVPGS